MFKVQAFNAIEQMKVLTPVLNSIICINVNLRVCKI